MGKRPPVPLDVDIVSLFDRSMSLSGRSVTVADYVWGGVIRRWDEAIVAGCAGPPDNIWLVRCPSAGIKSWVVVIVDDEVGYVGMCRRQ